MAHTCQQWLNIHHPTALPCSNFSYINVAIVFFGGSDHDYIEAWFVINAKQAKSK